MENGYPWYEFKLIVILNNKHAQYFVHALRLQKIKYNSYWRIKFLKQATNIRFNSKSIQTRLNLQAELLRFFL